MKSKTALTNVLIFWLTGVRNYYRRNRSFRTGPKINSLSLCFQKKNFLKYHQNNLKVKLFKTLLFRINLLMGLKKKHLHLENNNKNCKMYQKLSLMKEPLGIMSFMCSKIFSRILSQQTNSNQTGTKKLILVSLISMTQQLLKCPIRHRFPKINLFSLITIKDSFKKNMFSKKNS